MTTTPNEIPRTPEGIAAWLMGRHPWLRQMLAKIEEHPAIAEAWRRDVQAAASAFLPTPAVEVPEDVQEAADWLLSRHLWAQELVTRVVGDPAEHGHWLSVLAVLVDDGTAHAQDWAKRVRYNPPPSRDDDVDFWMEAVSEPSVAVMAFSVLPIEDQRVLRLLVTLHPRDEAGESVQPSWTVEDAPTSERSAALVDDWLTIVRRQQTETTEASR